MEHQAGQVIEARARRVLRQAALAALLLLAAGAPRSAASAPAGEDAAGEDVSIYAEPLDPAALPAPGYRVTLTAQLVNTREVNQTMHALVTIDGRVVSVLPVKSYLNKYDFPEYIFQIYAPIREASYQFVLTRKGTPDLFSERFTVVRGCSVNIEPVDAPLDPKLQGDELMNALVERSAALAREADLYGASAEMIGQIRKLLGELEK